MSVEHDASCDVDLAVTLAAHEAATLSRGAVLLGAENTATSRTIGNLLSSLGFKLRGTRNGFYPENLLCFGSAPAFTRQVVSWVLRHQGIAVTEVRCWEDDDPRIGITISDASVSERPLSARVPVAIHVDEPAAFATIRPHLVSAGFARLSIASLMEPEKARLSLMPGPLRRIEAHAEIAAICSALAHAATALGIDCARYPVQIIEPKSQSVFDDQVEIHLPSAGIRKGTIVPWAPSARERYEIEIFDDDRAAGRALEKSFRDIGFTRVRRLRLGKITHGFVLKHGKKVPETVREAVVRVLDEALIRLGAGDFGIAVLEQDGEEFSIEFPARALATGRLASELANPIRHALHIIGPSSTICEAAAAELRPWGFRSLRLSIDADDDPAAIKFGGAHNNLLDRIWKAMSDRFGIDLPTEKVWPMTDMDIYVRLPVSLMDHVTPEDSKPAISARLQLVSIERREPFLAFNDNAVRIGHQILPRQATSSPLVPSLDGFAGFCLDQTVADTIGFVVTALSRRFAVALEGPTAASKTWPVLYLAACLNQPVYRINLNQQSEVAELIGRFVPNGGGGFDWVDGAVPRAMLEGAWLLIDEANLAPTELLERLNSVLEPEPRLLMSENDYRVLGGPDLHPEFRVIATWNDADYAGRQELSPAFLDRFKRRIVPPAGEGEYCALARRLIYGEQPSVVVRGVRYAGGRETALLSEIARLVPASDRFITAFARLHAGLAGASSGGGDGIGAGGARPVVFTRRGFVDALSVMHDRLVGFGRQRISAADIAGAAWEGFQFCYLEQLSPDDKAKAVDLAVACGLQLDRWELPE